MDIKKLIRTYYGEFYTCRFDNLGEMDELLERDNYQNSVKEK